MFHNLIENALSTECNLVLPLSLSKILSYPEGHPVSAYLFFAFLHVYHSLYISFCNVFWKAVPMEHVTNAVKLWFPNVPQELLLCKIWLMVLYVKATRTEENF